MGSRMMDKQIQADREARNFRAGQYRNEPSPLVDTRPRPLALGGAVDIGQPVGTVINPLTDVRPRNNQSTITNVRPSINNMQPNVSTNINQSRSNVPLEERRAVDRVTTLEDLATKIHKIS